MYPDWSYLHLFLLLYTVPNKENSMFTLNCKGKLIVIDKSSGNGIIQCYT